MGDADRHGTIFTTRLKKVTNCDLNFYYLCPIPTLAQAVVVRSLVNSKQNNGTSTAEKPAGVAVTNQSMRKDFVIFVSPMVISE
jgi:hypothetical protein